jgi:hypothetical protein
MAVDDRDALEMPSAEAPAREPGRYDAVIEQWFRESFHGSPHMRDTAAFNHLRAKVDELKTRLSAL